MIARLAAQGEMAILLVEKYLDCALEIADDLLVMGRGEVVLSGAKATWTMAKFAGMTV